MQAKKPRQKYRKIFYRKWKVKGNEDQAKAMQAVNAFKNTSVLFYSVLELNIVNKHRTAYFLE